MKAVLPQTVDTDHDGVMQLAMQSIADVARMALDGSEPPVFALQWIYEMARMGSIVWLNEQYELPAVTS